MWNANLSIWNQESQTSFKTHCAHCARLDSQRTMELEARFFPINFMHKLPTTDADVLQDIRQYIDSKKDVRLNTRTRRTKR